MALKIEKEGIDQFAACHVRDGLSTYPTNGRGSFNIDTCAPNLLVFRNYFHVSEFLDIQRDAKMMSRYFFDLHNGDGATRDESGLELSTRESVTREVSRILLDVVQDEIAEQPNGAVSVVVRDDNGKAVSVANLTFSNAWFDDEPDE
jgi:hypothetical protein